MLTVASRPQHGIGSGWELGGQEAGLTLCAEESGPARSAVAGPILSAAARPVVAAACVEAGRAPEPRWASWGVGGMQRVRTRQRGADGKGEEGEHMSEPRRQDGAG